MAQRTRVNAGTQIGVSGPRGLTFSISAPDVRGAVDADEALQAWASGLSVNVRALPSTIAPASATPARRQVLVVTDTGAGAAATDLAKSVAGQMVTVQTDTVGDTVPSVARLPRYSRSPLQAGHWWSPSWRTGRQPRRRRLRRGCLQPRTCGSRRPAPRRTGCGLPGHRRRPPRIPGRITARRPSGGERPGGELLG